MEHLRLPPFASSILISHVTKVPVGANGIEHVEGAERSFLRVEPWSE